MIYRKKTAGAMFDGNLDSGPHGDVKKEGTVYA